MFFTGESGSQPPGRGNGSGRIPVFLAGPSDDGSGRRVGGSLTVRSSDQSTQLEEADAREAARLARVEGVDLQSSLAARFAGPRYVLTNFVLFNANSGAKVLGINVNPDSDISLSNMVYFKIDDPKNQLTPERVYQNYGTEGGQLRFYNDFVAGRITPIILNERLQDDSTPESFSNLERGWLNIYVNQENPPTHDTPLPLRINADDVYGLNADIRLVADIHTNAAMLDLIDIEAEPHLMPIRDAGNHIGSLIQIGARRITPELAEMLCQIRGNVTNVVAVIQGRWPSTTPASNINFNGDLSQVEFLLNRGDPILSESDQGAEHVIDVSDVRLNFFGFSNIQEFAFYSEAARHVIANNRTLEAAVEAISTGDEDPLSVVAAMPGVEEVAVEDDFNSLDTNERFIAVVVSETDDPDFPESEVFTPVQYRERCEERALSENEAIHFFRFTQSKGYESLRTSVRTSFSAEAGTFIRRDIRTRVSGDNLNDDGVYQDRMRNVRERGYRQVEPDVARIISEARGLRDTDWGVAVIHGSDHRVMVSAAAVDYARISPCDVIEFYVNGDEPFFRRVAGNVDVVGLDHLNRPLQIPYEMSALEAETYARAGALFWEESQSLNTLFMMVNDARLVDGLQFIASQPCFRLISSDPEEFLASPAADRPWVAVVVTNDWRSGIFPKGSLQQLLQEQGSFNRDTFSRFGFRGVHFFEIDEDMVDQRLGTVTSLLRRGSILDHVRDAQQTVGRYLKEGYRRVSLPLARGLAEVVGRMSNSRVIFEGEMNGETSGAEVNWNHPDLERLNPTCLVSSRDPFMQFVPRSEGVSNVITEDAIRFIPQIEANIQRFYNEWRDEFLRYRTITDEILEDSSNLDKILKRVNTRSENPMWLLSAMRGFELVPTEQEVSFVLNLGPNDEYVAAIVRTDGNVELVRSEYFVNFRNLFIDPATGTFSPELMQENGVARFRFFHVDQETIERYASEKTYTRFRVVPDFSDRIIESFVEPNMLVRMWQVYEYFQFRLGTAQPELINKVSSMSQEDRVTDVIASDINRRFDRLSEYLILRQRLFGSLRALLNLQEVPMQEFLRDQDSRYLVKMSRGRSQSFVAMDEQTARTYLGALDKDALRSEAGNFTFLRLDSSGFEQIFAGLTEFLTSFQERAATNAAPPEEASCPVQEGVARTPVSSSPVSSFVGRLVQYHVGMGDIPLTHDQALEILATNPNARFTAVVQTSDGFAVERALLTEQLADPSAGGVSEATFFAKTPDGRPIFPVDKNGEGELEQVRGRRGRRGGGGRGRGNGPFNRALERGRDPLEPFDVEDSLAGGFRTRTGIRAGKFDGEAMGTTLNNPDACRLFSRTELERVESTAADLPEGEAEVTQRITHEASAEERVADPLTRGLRVLTPQMTLGRFVSGSVTNTAIMAAGYGSTRLYEYIVGRRATTLEQHATGLAPIFLSIGATCLIHRTSPIPHLLHLPGGIAAIAPMGMAVSYAQQVMGINPESAEGLITHWVGTGILATLSSNAVLTYGGVGFSSAGLGMSFSGMLVGVASGIGVGAALAAGVAIGHHVVDPIWGRIINSLVGCVNEDFVESNDGTLSGVLAEALYRIV